MGSLHSPVSTDFRHDILTPDDEYFPPSPTEGDQVESKALTGFDRCFDSAMGLIMSVTRLVHNMHTQSMKDR